MIPSPSKRKQNKNWIQQLLFRKHIENKKYIAADANEAVQGNGTVDITESLTKEKGLRPVLEHPEGGC